MRRPFHVVAVAGIAAHHAYELAAGVGLIFQPQLGLRRAAALWSALLPAGAVAAARAPRRWDRPLAAALGGTIGAVAVHYAVWPWELRRGVPVLTDAEGLRGPALAAYNGLLLAWAAAGLLALAREVPQNARQLTIASSLAAVASGLAPGPLNIERHFTWLREQARTEPAWWNRAGANDQQGR